MIGTPTRPRLAVAKSLTSIFAQLIDDEHMVTIAGASSNSKVVASEIKDGMSKTDVARKVGEIIARLGKEKGIDQVVFDRGSARYHGRIKATADGAREGGLKF